MPACRDLGSFRSRTSHHRKHHCWGARIKAQLCWSLAPEARLAMACRQTVFLREMDIQMHKNECIYTFIYHGGEWHGTERITIIPIGPGGEFHFHDDSTECKKDMFYTAQDIQKGGPGLEQIRQNRDWTTPTELSHPVCLRPKFHVNLPGCIMFDMAEISCQSSELESKRMS